LPPRLIRLLRIRSRVFQTGSLSSKSRCCIESTTYWGSRFTRPTATSDARDVYFGKVVYSSGASQIPELFWLAARWGRRGLATVLDELIAFGALDGDEAPAVARRVLGGNAAGIYGLPWPPR
jgi:hypothetical protein